MQFTTIAEDMHAEASERAFTLIGWDAASDRGIFQEIPPPSREEHIEIERAISDCMAGARKE